MIATEQWRPVRGFEGLYEASDLGRIRSLPRATTAGRILKPADNGCGYPKVILCRDGKARTRTVHSLVAEAFMGVCPAGREVNHKNADKSDSSLSNLEFITHRENSQHAARLGLFDREARP